MSQSASQPSHKPQRSSGKRHSASASTSPPNSTFLNEVDSWLVTMQKGIRDLEDRHRRRISLGGDEDAKIAAGAVLSSGTAAMGPQTQPIIPPKSPNRRR